MAICGPLKKFLPVVGEWLEVFEADIFSISLNNVGDQVDPVFHFLSALDIRHKHISPDTKGAAS